MSVHVELPRRREHAPPLVDRIDDKRGTFGMMLFIATEATLFILLFFSYYYIGYGHPTRWLHEVPPKLHYSLPMLAVLALSSGVLYWGEKRVKYQDYAPARRALLGVLLLGVVFLVLTFFVYSEHLRYLTPRSNAYGSMFYTITGLHLAHLVLGMLMLSWVYFLPRWEPALRSPHRPYHNAGMYWHFVDTVWLFVVLLLYIAPNIHAARL